MCVCKMFEIGEPRGSACKCLLYYFFYRFEFFFEFFFLIKSVRKGNVSYLNKTDLDPT